jgi:hypothetical protein
MSTIGFAGPLKDMDLARTFASELKGPRRAEYLAAQKRHGVTRERVFVTETPMGAMIMAYREAPNAGFQMATLSASSNAFDKFYLESIAKFVGVDFASLPPGPPSHLAFEFTNGMRSRECTMLCAPVPEPSKFWKLCREMSMRAADHRESRERHGIVFEQAFYLHDAKMAVVYLEGDDPQGAMERANQSTASYDRWFVDQITAVHGIDFRSHAPPKAELLMLFDA